MLRRALGAAACVQPQQEARLRRLARTVPAAELHLQSPLEAAVLGQREPCAQLHFHFGRLCLIEADDSRARLLGKLEREALQQILGGPRGVGCAHHQVAQSAHGSRHGVRVHAEPFRRLAEHCRVLRRAQQLTRDAAEGRHMLGGERLDESQVRRQPRRRLPLLRVGGSVHKLAAFPKCETSVKGHAGCKGAETLLL